LAAVVLHKAKQKAATPPITTTKSIPKRNPTKYFPAWGYQIAYFKPFEIFIVLHEDLQRKLLSERYCRYLRHLG
jgi:hypothetical protein